jgi:branched-chain amino acid transport system permease protein
MKMFHRVLPIKKTSFSLKNIRLAVIAAIVIVLFVLPAFVSEYSLTLVINILIFSLFCLGTNVLLGHTGLLSFGQAAFYGGGAFACGKILLAYPNMILGILGGVVVATLLAVVLGWFAVRHTAIYFSMITLAFSMMIWALSIRWTFLGSHTEGISGIPRAPFEIPHLFSISLHSMTSYYLFAIIVIIIAIFLCYRITHSPLGLSFQGIRDSESRIGLTGFSVRTGRWLSFVISGAFCGLAGALIAPLNYVVSPLMLHWSVSIGPVIGCLLGGLYSFSGPIVGGAVYYIIKETVVRYTYNWMLPMGIIAIVIVLTFRKGIVGTFEENILPRLRTQMKRSFGERRDIEDRGT